MGEWKADAIRQAREQADAVRVQETLIQQKVGAAHREAFKAKFPGQVEHCMRLIAERLQLALRKDADVCLPARDIEAMSHALWHMYQIHQDLEPKFL